MTVEQKTMLDGEIEDAMASHDEARLRRVMARYIMAIGDCQYKTSERVKKLVVEEDREKQRIKGAAWAMRIIWVGISALASVAAYMIGRCG